MKLLLTLTAILELAAGIPLMVVPAPVISILIGGTLGEGGPQVLARMAGAALISLGVVCWQSRNTEGARGVVKAVLIYNVAASAILLYGAFGLGLSGPGLIPAGILHAALAFWCLAPGKAA